MIIIPQGKHNHNIKIENKKNFMETKLKKIYMKLLLFISIISLIFVMAKTEYVYIEKFSESSLTSYALMYLKVFDDEELYPSGGNHKDYISRLNFERTLKIPFGKWEVSYSVVEESKFRYCVISINASFDARKISKDFKTKYPHIQVNANNPLNLIFFEGKDEHMNAWIDFLSSLGPNKDQLQNFYEKAMIHLNYVELSL